MEERQIQKIKIHLILIFNALDMKVSIFDIFTKMLDSVPAKGIFRVVETECRMIEDDLLHERKLPLDEALSILTFYRFLKTADSSIKIISMMLPSNHIIFYRHIVQRLIESEELPLSAGERFDDVFYLRTLV